MQVLSAFQFSPAFSRSLRKCSCRGPILQPQAAINRQRWLVTKAKGFGEKPAEEDTKSTAEDEAQAPMVSEVDIKNEPEIAIESQVRRRKRRIAVAGKPEGRETLLGGPPSEDTEFENNIVLVLFSIFGLIIFEGIFLAGSGFLPKAVDDFALNVVYPVFSPTVVVFLLVSTFYGVWKSRQGGQEE